MLGDLRKKLEPAGRLDALDAVGERALKYYSAQDAGALDADSLGRRARALHLIGEVDDVRGNLDHALDVFRQAAVSTSELLARAPNDGARIFDHAQSVYWVGYVAWQHGDSAVAEKAFNEYRALADRLVAIDPGKSRLAGGGCRREQQSRDVADRPAPARRSRGRVRARAQRRRGAREQGPERRSSARTCAGRFLACVRGRKAGTPRCGLRASGKRSRDLRTLSLRRRSVTRRRISRCSWPSAASGESRLARGDGRKASEHLTRAIERSESLRALDPSNMLWIEMAAGARVTEAERLLDTGDLGQARSEIARVGELADLLAGHDAANVSWQITVADRHALLEARLAQADGDSEKPLETVRNLIGTLQSLRTDIRRATHRRNARGGRAHASRVARCDRKSADASAAWQRVAELLATDIESRDPRVRTTLAWAYFRLDRKDLLSAIVGSPRSHRLSPPRLSESRCASRTRDA